LQREAPDREEAAARHREIAAAQVISRRAEEREGESEEEEDEEALEARRAAVRERCVTLQSGTLACTRFYPGIARNLFSWRKALTRTNIME
jgi:hypothetical protein